MAAPQGTGKRRITLAMVLLAAASLITLDFQSFGPLGTVQTGLREVLAPIRSGGERLASPVTGLWEGATRYDELQAENVELREEIDRLRGDLVRDGIDRGDFEALLEMNGLEVPQGYPLLLAPVRTGTVGNFTTGVVEIERGSADGIQKDMAVVTRAGLVGRVEQVDRTSATVLLISSDRFVIGAEINGEIGLARGENNTERIKIEEGISGRAEIEVGDPVTTSSSDRSLFPPDLVIGTVQSRRVNEAKTTVVVELAANPVDLRFVSVVLVDPGEEVESAPVGIAR